jgi:isopentenyl-diphosphate Delta-isomerase
MEELVVLVDENNNPVGTAPKATVHTTDTPLHRAFSLFLFNSKKQLLLTKRAQTKKTFPGVWTNTVCGHVAPDETMIASATRRLDQELGIKNDQVRDLKEVSPYRYRFVDANGIVENEICPIFVGYFEGDPIPHPSEVDDWKWMDWEDFLQEISFNADTYSPWSREEALILQQKDLV